MSCSPVVNIYCNCPDDTSGGCPSTGGGQPTGQLIHLTAGYSPLMTDYSTAEIEQAGYNYPMSMAQPIINNFMPVHFPIRVVSAGIIKPRENNQPNGVMEVELIVLQNDGTVLRTISATSIDLAAMPMDIWSTFDLTTVAADLIVGVNEMFAIRVTSLTPGGQYSAGASFGALVEVLP